MKTLISFFVIFLMMLASCTKDQFNQDENLELKKAKVPVPIKADFCATPDMTAPMMLIPVPGLDPTKPENYLPSKMFVSGNATHTGLVDNEKSYTLVETLQFIVEPVPGGSPLFFLKQTGTGVITAANGDDYQITWWVKTSLANWTYIGEVQMFGGTGKFDGATGTVQMVGAVDKVAGTNCWTGDGFMEFEK